MRAAVLTWWTILRICLEERLVYRGDFALGTLMRFLPIVTQIFLWSAVFKASGQTTIGGYGSGEIIAYYLLTMVARAFSSMPGLASGIARQVRDGEIKKFLIQPIDLMSYLLAARVAHKLVYYAVATGPFALVFFLCRDYFPGWPEPIALAAFVLSLVLGFALGFFLEASMGLVAFWFLEVSSLLFIYMLFNFFCSGHMFPLEILPDWGRAIVDCLPLKYLAYFPAAVFFGEGRRGGVAQGLAIQTLWVVLFASLSRVLLHAGYRRYSGFGG